MVVLVLQSFDPRPADSFVRGDVGGGGVGVASPPSARLPGADSSAAAVVARSGSSCQYGTRSDGSCRACPNPDEYHNGKKCVKKRSSASSDPPCPTGRTYFSSYSGCRPSSCSYGRTSSGYCRSRPTTTTTTTTPVSCPYGTRQDGSCRACPNQDEYHNGLRCVKKTVASSTTTTTSSVVCNYGTRLDGSCRICPKRDEYHNGDECVKKTAPAPTDPTCPVEGEVYYSGYDDCLPSSCPHGRTSTGTCQDPPAPTTLPTTAVPAATTTNTVVSASTISECPTTAGSVITTTTTTATVATTAAVTSSTSASSRVWSALELAKPLGVAANGHVVTARSLEPFTEGGSILTWDAVPGAARYWLWCGLYSDPSDIYVGYTTNLVYRYDGLSFNTMYRVRVIALDDNWKVLQSEVVYTYPTLAVYGFGDFDRIYPLPVAGSEVGPIPILGVRPSREYEYVICEDTLNAKTAPSSSSMSATFTTYSDSMAEVSDKDEWMRQVENGIEIWETAVGSDMITVTRTTDVTDCSGLNPPTNRIVRITERDADLTCLNAAVNACVVPGSQIDPGSQIYIRDNVIYTNPQECWDPNTGQPFVTDPDGHPLPNVPSSVQLFRVAMHEAGHTLGLNDFPRDPSSFRAKWDDKTVMNMSHDRLCSPTELDIAAVKGLYQSRRSNPSLPTPEPNASPVTTISTTKPIVPSTRNAVTTTVPKAGSTTSTLPWQEATIATNVNHTMIIITTTTAVAGSSTTTTTEPSLSDDSGAFTHTVPTTTHQPTLTATAKPTTTSTTTAVATTTTTTTTTTIPTTTTTYDERALCTEGAVSDPKYIEHCDDDDTPPDNR